MLVLPVGGDLGRPSRLRKIVFVEEGRPRSAPTEERSQVSYFAPISKAPDGRGSHPQTPCKRESPPPGAFCVFLFCGTPCYRMRAGSYN